MDPRNTPMDRSAVYDLQTRVGSRSALVSALGHKRTFCDAIVMSALPPKADIKCDREPAPTPRGKARHSRPFHLGRVAARRGEMNMEISGAWIGELPFDCLF
jgi:hypothetical protein